MNISQRGNSQRSDSRSNSQRSDFQQSNSQQKYQRQKWLKTNPFQCKLNKNNLWWLGHFLNGQ